MGTAADSRDYRRRFVFPPSRFTPARGVPGTVLAPIQDPSRCSSSANRCRFLPSITRTVSRVARALVAKEKVVAWNYKEFVGGKSPSLVSSPGCPYREAPKP